MFGNIILIVTLGFSVATCSGAAPAAPTKEQATAEKESHTSRHMQRVLSEIEDFSSGVPSMVEFSHHNKDGKKTKSFVAPVIIFKESVAIFDIPNSAILLVENTNRNQDAPEIDQALVLFLSRSGKKVVGDIDAEDTVKLLQAVSSKFQDFFQEKTELEESDPIPIA